MMIFGLISFVLAVFGGIIGWFSFRNTLITVLASFGLSLLSLALLIFAFDRNEVNSLRTLETLCFWLALPYFFFFAIPTMVAAVVVAFVRRGYQR